MRVDTVHQGDQDGAKGVYHINAVDEVTQFQFVGTVEAISERFLLPVLEGLIKAFPFVIQGIHADNGSESINHRVTPLVNEFTQHVLSPFLNTHRPCMFPADTLDDKGRVTKRYRDSDVMTPYDKLKSLDNAQRFLNPGVTFDQLDAIAHAVSDLEAAHALNDARDALFRTIGRAWRDAA